VGAGTLRAVLPWPPSNAPPPAVGVAGGMGAGARGARSGPNAALRSLPAGAADFAGASWEMEGSDTPCPG
ncbi:MAG: hypothetical protein M3N00_02630, partial [Actinomycetota bacterium]|nr:hypothetical protein [Actinomycetota bacterium]